MPTPTPRSTVPGLKQLQANDELKAVKNRFIKWDVSDWETPNKVVASSLAPNCNAYRVSSCLMPIADGLVSLLQAVKAVTVAHICVYPVGLLCGRSQGCPVSAQNKVRTLVHL